MKLVTYSHQGELSTGAMRGDAEIIDLGVASAGTLPSSMIELLAGGDEALDAARVAIEKASADAVVALSGDVRIEPPVPRPGKVLGIGLNYRDHAAESGQELPPRPVVFAKMSSCITGPGMPVQRPKASAAVDWEGELCFVIGTGGRHISQADALSHVAGYMNGNDISVRDWQFHSPTWMMGKGFDTHGPIGPWLVTRDEVPDVHALDIATWVNDEQVQRSNTKNLVFGVPAIIEYISTAFTLEPGDVVFTGTPAGVGVSRKPPRFLKAGDVVRVEISGLGVLENPVVDEP